MKALAYALVGCMILMAAPVVVAEENPSEEGCDGQICWPHCSIFEYYIDPFGYQLQPECLFPLPP